VGVSTTGANGSVEGRGTADRTPPQEESPIKILIGGFRLDVATTPQAVALLPIPTSLLPSFA
jgi:hypothetical protein